eukprot:TRINITY_DN31905_c0_g1_i1.p4 TRINITY_DN31905_c0_g1~~TRINITY_DN31905_c0_g1_i1.p4  ORF type:complete len:103 (+),score=12.24 TRINITY_DN31905_c0_g1_i1:349-657(+)
MPRQGAPLLPTVEQWQAHQDNPEAVQVLAWYAGDVGTTRYARSAPPMAGCAAIVAGVYGRGRVLCFGPHPEKTTVPPTAGPAAGAELNTGHLVANAVRWAAG